MAAELLGEGGSAALTARAVAERLGVSVGTIYGSFASLSQLKLEANTLTMRSLHDHLARTASGANASPEQALLALAHGYLDFARSHRRPWTALFDATTLETPSTLAAEIARLFALVEEVLARIEGLAPQAVPVLAKALWSGVHGIVYLGESGNLGPVDREEVPAMIDALVRAAIRGLG